MKPAGPIDDHDQARPGGGTGQAAGDRQGERDRPGPATHIAGRVAGREPLKQAAPPHAARRQQGIDRGEPARDHLAGIFPACELPAAQEAGIQ
jgi:hypothetical protein